MTDSTGSASHRRWQALAVVAVAVPVVLGAMLVAGSRRSARTGLEERFHTRGALSARFVSTYVSQLAQTEQRVATKHLAAASVTQRDFEQVAETFGFHAAVLLNDRGELLNVYPGRDDIVGQDFGTRYPHLATAVAGGVGVSNVTASAAEGIPIVAVAVPFDTPQGRRVFSGAYSVEATPLAAFLRDSTPIRGSRAFLVDGSGSIAARTGPELAGVLDMSAEEPQLARLTHTATKGSFTSADVPQFFATHAVEGTSWRLVTAVPSGTLFGPIAAKQWVPWLILGGFALALAAAAWLMLRNVEARARLAAAYSRLEEISRTDVLTHVYTRRHLGEHLGVSMSRARRHDSTLPF